MYTAQKRSRDPHTFATLRCSHRSPKLKAKLENSRHQTRTNRARTRPILHTNRMGNTPTKTTRITTIPKRWPNRHRAVPSRHSTTHTRHHQTPPRNPCTDRRNSPKVACSLKKRNTPRRRQRSNLRQHKHNRKHHPTSQTQKTINRQWQSNQTTNDPSSQPTRLPRKQPRRSRRMDASHQPPQTNQTRRATMTKQKPTSQYQVHQTITGNNHQTSRYITTTDTEPQARIIIDCLQQNSTPYNNSAYSITHIQHPTTPHMDLDGSTWANQQLPGIEI